MQVVVWTSEELGLKVPGEALVPYLDMMVAWLKLKLDKVAHSARNTCCKHELTLAGEARVHNAATTDKKPKLAAKALARPKWPKHAAWSKQKRPAKP